MTRRKAPASPSTAPCGSAITCFPTRAEVPAVAVADEFPVTTGAFCWEDVEITLAVADGAV